ncbi:MAG: catalase family protein [Gammaproteobacteria bacterium]|nr:catalase family protein [Gammaproteobacteria bacterium]
MDSEPKLERIPPDESERIAALGQRLKEKVIRDNAGGPIRRDAHPKMHGLVTAEFIIEPDLPGELAVGLFREPGRFPAWIRFSNQDGKLKPDIRRDIRGMAIKLMGVPGEKLLPTEENAPTHDFLTISTDVFVTRDVAEFDDLVKVLTGNLVAQLFFFLTHWRVTWNLIQSMSKFANPLQIRYFSTTPYLLGTRAVKYSVIPHPGPTDTIPAKPGENYLREAMTRQLDREEALFDFCVQVQKGPEEMPVEDPGKRWDESLSPFLKVATIRIPRQTFSTPVRDKLGENLSFTPWHALPEHRPLGGINRGRKIIYDMISAFRHRENEQPRREPAGFDGEDSMD